MQHFPSSTHQKVGWPPCTFFFGFRSIVPEALQANNMRLQYAMMHCRYEASWKLSHFGAIIWSPCWLVARWPAQPHCPLYFFAGRMRGRVHHPTLSQSGCLATRAEIAVPQLGLPALVLDHVTLRQQDRAATEIKENVRGKGKKWKRKKIVKASTKGSRKQKHEGRPRKKTNHWQVQSMIIGRQVGNSLFLFILCYRGVQWSIVCICILHTTDSTYSELQNSCWSIYLQCVSIWYVNKF